jgi:predicted DNA-binding protein
MPKQTKKLHSFRLSQNVYTKLEQLAGSNNISKTDVIEELILNSVEVTSTPELNTRA